MPDVRKRLQECRDVELSLRHGDFKANLRRFDLVEEDVCESGYCEAMKCELYGEQRSETRNLMTRKNLGWNQENIRHDGVTRKVFKEVTRRLRRRRNDE